MKKFITAAMAAIMAFGAFAFTGCDNVHILQNPTNTNTPGCVTDFESGEFIVGGLTNENGVSLLSVPIESSEYMTYNIPQSAESAVLVTATVEPITAVDYVTITWTTKWSNPSSAWASGKTVTDYVTVAKAGKSTATVTCLQPFGEQVEVVCRVTGVGVTLTDSVTCDYMARPTSISWDIAGTEAAFGTQDVWTHGTSSKGSAGNCTLSGGYHYQDYSNFNYREATFGNIQIESQTVGTRSTTNFTLTATLSPEFYEALIKNGFEVKETSVSYQGTSFDDTFEDIWFILPGATQGVQIMCEEMWANNYVDSRTLDDCLDEYIRYQDAVVEPEVGALLDVRLSLTNADYSIVYETYDVEVWFNAASMLPDPVAKVDSLKLDGDITF